MGIFDFPPFYQLRNLIYTLLFKVKKGLTVGRKCVFIWADFMMEPYPYGQLKIGSNVAINHHVEIDFSGGVILEDGVWISQNVLIETHTHQIKPESKINWDITRSSLVIEKEAWIGANAIIMDSVRKIGEGAIVGAGAVVTKDVEPFTIVVGIPAVVKSVLQKRTI